MDISASCFNKLCVDNAEALAPFAPELIDKSKPHSDILFL